MDHQDHPTTQQTQPTQQHAQQHRQRIVQQLLSDLTGRWNFFGSREDRVKHGLLRSFSAEEWDAFGATVHDRCPHLQQLDLDGQLKYTIQNDQDDGTNIQEEEEEEEEENDEVPTTTTSTTRTTASSSSSGRRNGVRQQQQPPPRPPSIRSLLTNIFTSRTLRIVDVGNNDLTDRHAAWIANAFQASSSLPSPSPPPLERLTLSGNRIGPRGIRALVLDASGIKCSLLLRSLQDLYLDRNRVGFQGCRALGTALSDPRCRLQKLSLTETNIHDMDLVQLCCPTASSSTTIRTGDCMANGGGQSGSYGYGGLASNRSLQRLWLDRNRIGCIGYQALAIAFMTNDTLLRLSIQHQKPLSQPPQQRQQRRQQQSRITIQQEQEPVQEQVQEERHAQQPPKWRRMLRGYWTTTTTKPKKQKPSSSSTTNTHSLDRTDNSHVGFEMICRVLKHVNYSLERMDITATATSTGRRFGPYSYTATSAPSPPPSFDYPRKIQALCRANRTVKYLWKRRIAVRPPPPRPRPRPDGEDDHPSEEEEEEEEGTKNHTPNTEADSHEPPNEDPTVDDPTNTAKTTTTTLTTTSRTLPSTCSAVETNGQNNGSSSSSLLLSYPTIAIPGLWPYVLHIVQRKPDILYDVLRNKLVYEMRV